MTPPLKVPRVSMKNPVRHIVNDRTLEELRRLNLVRENGVRNLVIVMQWRLMRRAGIRSGTAILALAEEHCLSPERTQDIVYKQEASLKKSC